MQYEHSSRRRFCVLRLKYINLWKMESPILGWHISGPYMQNNCLHVKNYVYIQLTNPVTEYFNFRYDCINFLKRLQ